METRSSDILLELGEIIIEKKSLLDLSVVQQLPSNHYILSRYLTLQEGRTRGFNKKKEEIYKELAEELRGIWIFMNVSPMTIPGVKKKLKTVLGAFDTHRFTHVSKRGLKWSEYQKKLCLELENGFDIRGTKTEVIKNVQSESRVKETSSESRLYKDNCVPDATGVCPRQRWCGEVDKDWLSKSRKRSERDEYEGELEEKRKENEEQDSVERKERLENEMRERVTDVEGFHEDEDDESFLPPGGISKCIKTPNVNVKKYDFPTIPTRSGYKSINNDIMETLIVMESVYKVPARKSLHLLAYIANKLFHQNWIVPETEKEEENRVEEKRRREEDVDMSDSETPKREKRKRSVGYLDNALPCRHTIASGIKDFALLSFADMAETINEAHKHGKVVTYGTDDTVKAAGKKKIDMKTTHVTIIDADHNRETFTSGFYENASHGGEFAADTVRHDIAKMAILTGNTYEDMLKFIDFFMTDRAGDATTMLNNLDIEEGRRLKCNAHIMLGVDVSIDKVLKDTETLIGPSALISQNASHVFNSPKSSIWMLGLIAFAKLLSPSHTKETISLYCDYKRFLTEDCSSESSSSATSRQLLKGGFDGFSSNRFGRIGQISDTVVKHQTLIKKYFDKAVDEHSNRLVLAVHAYQRSEWFLFGCEIASQFHEVVTIPIKRIIGMDEFKNTTCSNRSWHGMKTFFKNLLKTLETYKPRGCKTKGQEVLVRKVAKQIKETLERQLGAMKFYRDEPIDQEIKKKMKQTPMTNCGSEHEFAHADNDLRQSGGSTSLTTVSSKHVIKQNELYKKEKWTCLSEEERTERWRWAHGSEEAKKVRQLDKEFQEKLKALQKVAYEEKVAKKQASDRKFLEILEKCKKHGGPITMKEVEKLEALTYDEVLLEVKFLKRTTGPQLRIKRKVEKKFVNYTRDQLIQQIKDVLKPCMESDIRLENLLATALDLTEGDETSVPENRHNSSPPIGAHGLWSGPRDEQILGVLVDDTTIQKYKKTRTGYLPFGLPDNAAEWELVEVIPDDKYHYVQKNHGVYLVLE